MTQIDLYGETLADRQFRQFHERNPDVYEELRRLALELVLDHGATKIGIRMLWEVMRWHWMRSYRPPDEEFKLNDHYHSRYARLLMANEPELAGVFETRTLKS